MLMTKWQMIRAVNNLLSALINMHYHDNLPSSHILTGSACLLAQKGSGAMTRDKKSVRL